MRTFNGLQIFTTQLTQSGQLDSRYVRITGDAFVNDNLYIDYDLYKNQNFNVVNAYNLFLSDNSGSYTGYLPNIIDKQSFFVKNISSTYAVFLKSFFTSRPYFTWSKNKRLYWLGKCKLYSRNIIIWQN